MNDLMDQAGRALRKAKNIAILTGAGISAESGIPTFRDALTGLWAMYDPAELATPEAFACNPGLVTKWYDERRCEVARCRPNPGHLALAELQCIVQAKGLACTVITQNVDRLHQAAGAKEVIELHGSLWVWQCVDCRRQVDETGPAFTSYPPRCPCGGLRRPAVVWFGEELPEHAWTAAQQAAGGCDYFISVGTSSLVYPAAGLIQQAIGAGAKVLEVNPETTPFSSLATWSIRRTSGQILPWIMEEAFGFHRGSSNPSSDSASNNA